jgi:hypothetical protein
MPKHIIEFDLPEENEELETVMNAGKYYSCLSSFSMLLREKYKYSENQNVTWEQVRELFDSILEDNDVDLN